MALPGKFIILPKSAGKRREAPGSANMQIAPKGRRELGCAVQFNIHHTPASSPVQLIKVLINHANLKFELYKDFRT